MDIIKELHDYGLVPVIKITDVKNAIPLAKALAEGGLNCAEITFRTSCAKEAIAEITKAVICQIGAEMPAKLFLAMYSVDAHMQEIQKNT